MSRSGHPLQTLGLGLAVAATYTLAGKLGLSLAFVNASATAVWPPTGIALAATLLFGYRIWPGIFLGAFLTNQMTAGTAPTSLLIAVGNTLEALVGAYLVKRFVPGYATLRNGRDLVLFILLAALLSTTISATVGVTTLAFFGLAPWPAYGSIWFTWWLGDATGAVVVAPAILFWAISPRVSWSRSQRIERRLLIATVAVVGWLVFIRSGYPLSFLCIPVCLWAAFRFGPREAATTTCLLSIFAIWGSSRGLGTFASEPNDALLLVQAFMAVVSIVGITVGAAVSGRRIAEAGLRQANSDLESEVRARTRDLALSEARLAEAQEVAHLGSWEWNLADNSVSWSDELYRICGFDRSIKPMLDTFLAAFPAEDGPLAAVVREAARDRQLFDVEHRFIRSEGDVRVLRSRGRAASDSSGQVVRMVGTVEDITDRRRIEEQLHHGQKMEAIGRLAGGVAHDFNNLLTTIGGYSDMMLVQIGPDKPISADLQEIQRAVASATALTRQLLLLSRKDAPRAEPVDLNVLVARVSGLLRRTIGEDIVVLTQLADEVEAIHADQTHLDQIVLNLATNARDAMPQGGTLTFRTSNVDLRGAGLSNHPRVKPGRYVELVVSDTGTGMDTATQARIFEPFFTTKARGCGTGLGLAMVYAIVEQYHGSIRVSSQIGHGTTFTLYFPTDGLTAQTASPGVPDAAASLLGTEAVLVVEDDDNVRALVMRVLKRYGYAVVGVDSPVLAIEHLQGEAGPCDVVLTDMVMPGMSGHQLGQWIEARFPETRLLYMSGYADRANGPPAAAVARGAFLEKPFTPLELLRKVREALDSTPTVA